MGNHLIEAIVDHRIIGDNIEIQVIWCEQDSKMANGSISARNMIGACWRELKKKDKQQWKVGHALYEKVNEERTLGLAKLDRQNKEAKRGFNRQIENTFTAASSRPESEGEEPVTGPSNYKKQKK